MFENTHTKMEGCFSFRVGCGACKHPHGGKTKWRLLNIRDRDQILSGIYFSISMGYVPLFNMIHNISY